MPAPARSANEKRASTEDIGRRTCYFPASGKQRGGYRDSAIPMLFRYLTGTPFKVAAR